MGLSPGGVAAREPQAAEIDATRTSPASVRTETFRLMSTFDGSRSHKVPVSYHARRALRFVSRDSTVRPVSSKPQRRRREGRRRGQQGQGRREDLEEARAAGPEGETQGQEGETRGQVAWCTVAWCTSRGPPGLIFEPRGAPARGF